MEFLITLQTVDDGDTVDETNERGVSCSLGIGSDSFVTICSTESYRHIANNHTNSKVLKEFLKIGT